MSSERLISALDDIVRAIDLIDAWVTAANGAEKALQPETQPRSAIERQLLIVSEAAIRMHKIESGVAMRLAPDVDWDGVRGIGNFIRHKYDDLDSAIIADVIGPKLAALKAACVAAASGLRGGA